MTIPIIEAAPSAVALIIPSFLIITFGDLIEIFPSSIDICIPKAPNSLIAGPGTKLVGPALTSISSGAICPAFTEQEFRDVCPKNKFNKPASLGGTIQQDEAKNSSQTGFQPNDFQLNVQRQT